MIGSSNWKQTPNHTGEFGSISLGASAAWLGAAYAQRYAVEVNRLHDMAAIMVEILRGYTLPVRGDHGAVPLGAGDW